MITVETVLLVSVVLALLGVLRVLTNATADDGERRFLVYLVGLLLVLVLVGYLLLVLG
ncbi:MAG: hypothetical protein ACOCSD_07040 [Halolamina sp.]